MLVFALWQGQVIAQLNVTTGQTAQQLAEIIAGPGVVVSNASIIGDADAIGAFTSGANNTGLGIPSGVVMASGEVVDIGQGSANFAGSTMGTPGDPYLANLANTSSNDAVILQFDFVPNADFVSFNYAFGSEEYPEFICSAGGYNDMFAFTIQGVTVPLPQTNIALIPGTTLGVSINNINDDPGCGGDYSQYYIDNSFGPASQYIVYDGLTVVLTAETPVICGETYTLRLMLSDGGDSAFDSGCFIEENSLTTGSVIVETATAAADSTAYEGCNEATVTLTLNGPPLAQDFPVPIWISDATAEYGIDYDDIPELNQQDSTVIIPAGQNTISFTIDPVNDQTIEGTEYIEFTAITSTCGFTSTFRIYIDDLDPISLITSNDTTICTGNAIVWVEAEGGGGDYTYTWDNGFGEADTILPSPTETTTYTVSVDDNCNSATAVDSVVVTVDDGPTPFAGNDVAVCIGGSVVLNATSDTPGSTFEWTPTTGLSDPEVFNPICTPQQNTEYIVTVTRPDGCSNDDTVLVSITPPPTGEFDIPTTGCEGSPVIVEYAGNASPAAQYQWDFDGGVVTNGSGGGPIAVYWPAAGTYDVELTVSWNGCVSPTETNQIEIIGTPAVDAGVDVAFCSGESAVIGVAPQPGIAYSWTPINGLQDATASTTTVELENNSNEIQTIQYALTASDQGCENTDVMEVTVYPIPQPFFSVPNGICFNVNSFDLEAEGEYGSSATFEWDFGPVGYPSSSTLQSPEGVIFNAPGPQDVSLTITENGCVSDPFIGTIQVYEMPTADFTFAPADGCEPLLVQFEDASDNVGSVLYHTWDFGNESSATQANPSTYYEAGVYSVSLSVVTANGCADAITKSNIIEAYPKPNALFSMSSQTLSILDPKVTVTNLADSVVSSEFTFQPFGDVITAMQTEYEYPDTGSYIIEQIVTTANGCMDTIIGRLKVEPFYTLYIPNAFTPDANDINEVWIPQGESIKEFEMTIYNRWNQELFYSASLDEGWDGTFKGRPVPQGVYVYSIEVLDILGEPHIYRGRFSLIRSMRKKTSFSLPM